MTPLFIMFITFKSEDRFFIFTFLPTSHSFLLGLEVIFSSEWFVEFQVTPESRISIADERHSSVKSSEGKGITLTLEVEDIESVWKDLDQIKLKPGKIKKHPWKAKVFYMKNPEGHRIEVWQKCE